MEVNTEDGVRFHLSSNDVPLALHVTMSLMSERPASLYFQPGPLSLFLISAWRYHLAGWLTCIIFSSFLVCSTLAPGYVLHFTEFLL